MPNPDALGVMLYLDVHEQDSQAEIHMQPLAPRRRFGDREVLLLLLEGERTRSLHPLIEGLLRDAGVEAVDAAP